MVSLDYTFYSTHNKLEGYCAQKLESGMHYRKMGQNLDGAASLPKKVCIESVTTIQAQYGHFDKLEDLTLQTSQKMLQSLA